MATPAISAPTREVEGEVIWARPGVARPDVLWSHEAAFGLQRKQGGVKKHANQLASVSTAFIHDSPCGRVGGPQTGHVRGAGRLQLRTLSLQAAETREREPTWLLAGRWPGRRLRTNPSPTPNPSPSPTPNPKPTPTPNPNPNQESPEHSPKAQALRRSEGSAPNYEMVTAGS